PQRVVGLSAHAEAEEIARIRPVLDAAALADAPDQPLGQHADQGRAYEIRLAPHVLEAYHRPRGVVGVERGQHEMAGEGGLDGDLRRLAVADPAHQDYVA